MKFQLFLMVALVVLAAALLPSAVDAVRPCDMVCERGPDHVRECCRAHGYSGGHCSSGWAYCG